MKTITLGDMTFAVQDEGDGPPVVLLHGFPDSHMLWRRSCRHWSMPDTT